MKTPLRRHVTYTLLLIASLGSVYLLGSYFYFRIDLTEDRRYSIHPATKELLKALKEELCVEVYLEGDLPVELKQLKRATKELLEELKVHARHQLHYRFVDLDKEPIEKKKTYLLKLAAKGIQPSNLYIQEKGQRTEKLIFPAALLTYQDKEEGVLLLKGNKMASPAQIVNQSMEGLEYELASAVERLVCSEQKQVALLRGHGEPDLSQLSGLISALREHYVLHIIDFPKQPLLSAYDAVLITKPQYPFAEKEKYLLDQYIMQGGKVLFFLDRLCTNMENVRKKEAFAFPLKLDLDDQLFKYGVRINPDLVQDLHAGLYPVVVGNLGNQPQLKLLPWPFFPVLNCFADHLVTKNMDVLYTQFVSSMDAIQVKGVTQTPLIFTSQYSRRLGAPVHVDLEALRKPPQVALYNHGHLPLAYLLEGSFTSLYKNRFLPEEADPESFLDESVPTKLFVFTSGSLVTNAIDPKKKQALPWGYDPFLQQHFANKDFVLNTLAYMLKEGGLINLKHKVLKIRLLDQVKVEQEKLLWQFANLTIPILLLSLLGILWNYLYKKAYKRIL